ncbi:TetR family transcriptional regulator [Fontibacillus phaseoli]|uniref:TetR family transcriptional regulator n=1 Tax=Fontibacillus phaseoli TaxID=1416533 RepID=A0A369B9W4_9BACL|nr:TetR/AcrR family transcriptional regulator [Fontibacillus phaseoli]RCX18191.1 TetR family transcriptional regulator [Fontibacillus phaseoli]
MRTKIMEAAKTEFAYRGLKFSIRDITAQLGISSKTLYQYFASKEELVTALTLDAIDEMKQTEASILKNPSLSLQEKIREALVVLPSAIMIKDLRLLDDLRRSYPQAWSHAEKYIRESWSGVGKLVKEGIRQGIVREFDFDLFIQMYVGSLYGMMETRGNGVPSAEDIGRMVDILLHGIYIGKEK